jgi:hypothetical protein
MRWKFGAAILFAASLHAADLRNVPTYQNTQYNFNEIEGEFTLEHDRGSTNARMTAKKEVLENIGITALTTYGDEKKARIGMNYDIPLPENTYCTITAFPGFYHYDGGLELKALQLHASGDYEGGWNHSIAIERQFKHVRIEYIYSSHEHKLLFSIPLRK